jgi:hypothetical protein
MVFLLLTSMASTAWARSSSTGAMTVAEVLARAPSSRGPRRQALLTFARSDRAALVERRAAVKAALALADRPSEQSTRRDLWVLQGGLADLAGDDAGRKRALNSVGNKAPWSAADDEARAVVVALGELVDEAAFTAGEGLVVSPPLARALSSARQALRRTPAKPPASSVFAARRALVSLLVDDDRGLVAAVAQPRRRAGLVKRLKAFGSARGSRDTAALRALALEVRGRLNLDDGRRQDGALDVLRADRLRALDPGVAVPDLPPPHAASSPRTRALCLLLEQQTPVVSCDALEEERLGGVTFVDASRAPEHAFSAEEAQLVLADHDVLLQRCLTQGAKDNLTTQTVVQLEWAIGNDGVVTSHDLRPMRLRGTSVETCITAALGVFRFGRYPGEMQHLRIDFEVGGEL